MFLVLNLAKNGRNQRCSRTAQDNYRLTTPSLLSRGTCEVIHDQELARATCLGSCFFLLYEGFSSLYDRS